MPTGYTAGILDGKTKTFEQFAKNCMRAFGATIHMRDEPNEKEYEPRVPSTYYSENVVKAKAALEELKIKTDDEIISEETKRINESIKYNLESLEKQTNNLNKLKGMLNEAEEFVPPTAEHVQFKNFMIDQLKNTIDFDCSSSWHKDNLQSAKESLKNMDAGVIRNQRIEEANKSLAYYIKSMDEEIGRCANSNKWVEELVKAIAK